MPTDNKNNPLNQITMKKLFLIISLSINSIYAQMVVSDPTVNSTLLTMKTQTSSDNRAIIDELRELNSTLKDKKAIQEEMRDREKRAEDALFTVPQYIKNGAEINSILDSEVNILKLIQQLKNIASNLQGSNISSFIKPILATMEKDVTSATQICTDNMYRMSAEDRRKYLNDINQRMVSKQNLIQNKILELEKAILFKANNDNSKKIHFELMNKKITPNN